MDWSLFYVVMAIAAAGISLMLAAFALVLVRGGWQRAMQPDATGRWPLPRRLLLAGAVLVMLFGLLLFVPGAVPYWDLSSPATPWLMGAIFGFSVSTLYHRITQAIRHGGSAETRANEHRHESPA
jgi:phosphatidylglycerophosphate synthase